MNLERICEFIMWFILSCLACCCFLAVIIGIVVGICLLINFNIYVAGAVIIGACSLYMTIGIMKEK